MDTPTATPATPDPALVAAKLKVNVANSAKMLSVQFMSAVTAALLAVMGYVAQMPADQQLAIATAVLNHLGYTSLLPIAVFAIHYYARVKPQANLTPAVAEAKSVEPDPSTASTNPPPPAAPQP